MYNLLYYQVVVQICSSLTDSECDEIISKYSTEPLLPVTGVSSLGAAIALVLDEMMTMKSTLLRRESADQDANRQTNIVRHCLLNDVVDNATNFMRFFFSSISPFLEFIGAEIAAIVSTISARCISVKTSSLSSGPTRNYCH